MWTATFADGTTLKQYPADGGSLNIKDLLKRGNPVRFSLSVYGQKFTISLEDDRRLIYRKRHLMKSTGEHQEFYLLGWQKQVQGENVQSILFIMKDEVISAGRWGTGIFAEPKFYEYM